MKCKCRTCGKVYDDQKSRADFTGYCGQKCMTEKAKKLGWRPGDRYPLDLYARLKEHGEVGSVPAKEGIPRP